MRILFITNPHAGLYRKIEDEMKRQGHEVFTIIDNPRLGKDPHFGTKYPFKKYIFEKNLKKYWKYLIAALDVFRNPIDILFILSGVTVTKEFVINLKMSHPRIKVVLYTWDGCRFYPYERLLPYVDKAYTFDIEDSINNKKWKLLPIFCEENSGIQSNDNNEIDVFMVGTSHDGRYHFYKKLLPQLKRNHINYYIKIIPNKENISLIGRFKFAVKWIFMKSVREETRFNCGLENKELLLEDLLSPSEYKKKQQSALCILDDQRDGQSGLTARFMWALSARRKIVTTNEWAYQYDFVSKKQVAIISKENPKFPLSFLKEELKEEDCSNVEPYMISSWVKEILR